MMWIVERGCSVGVRVDDTVENACVGVRESAREAFVVVIIDDIDDID